jgi:hypothetical protein
VEDHALVDLELHTYALVLEDDVGHRPLAHAAHRDGIAFTEVPDLFEPGGVVALPLPDPVLLDPGDGHEQEEDREQSGHSHLDRGPARRSVHP